MNDILVRAEAIKAKLGNGELHWLEYKAIVPELIDEIKQQAAYVTRLEAAYLQETRRRMSLEERYTEPSDWEEAASEALERIKRGEQG